MSEPAWVYKLERAMFEYGNDPVKMAEWLLKDDTIPRDRRNALLVKYNYTPQPIEPKVNSRIPADEPKRRGRPRKVKQDE
jgi:hypothetical protein